MGPDQSASEAGLKPSPLFVSFLAEPADWCSSWPKSEPVVVVAGVAAVDTGADADAAAAVAHHFQYCSGFVGYYDHLRQWNSVCYEA